MYLGLDEERRLLLVQPDLANHVAGNGGELGVFAVRAVDPSVRVAGQLDPRPPRVEVGLVRVPPGRDGVATNAHGRDRGEKLRFF